MKGEGKKRIYNTSPHPYLPTPRRIKKRMCLFTCMDTDMDMLNIEKVEYIMLDSICMDTDMATDPMQKLFFFNLIFYQTM